MYYLEDNIILTPLERLEPANYDLLSMHYKKTSELYFPFYHLLRCGRRILRLIRKILNTALQLT